MSANPTSQATAAPFHAVYHVTVINHWQMILAEQLGELLDNRHVESLNVTLAARDTAGAAAAQKAVVERVAQRIPCEFRTSRLEEFEHPAMRWVEELVRQDDSPVLYFHMKGVSFAPPRPNREVWRRHMQGLVAAADRWAEFLRDEPYDACGSLRLFDQAHGYTYFAGNFWMASAAYLRRLPPYDEFLERHGIAGFEPRARFLAELAVNRARTMRGYAIDGRSFGPDTIGAFLRALIPSMTIDGARGLSWSM